MSRRYVKYLPNVTTMTDELNFRIQILDGNKFAHFNEISSVAQTRPYRGTPALVHISKTSHRDSNEAIPPDGFQRMDIECDKQGNVKKF